MTKTCTGTLFLQKIVAVWGLMALVLVHEPITPSSSIQDTAGHEGVRSRCRSPALFATAQDFGWDGDGTVIGDAGNNGSGRGNGNVVTDRNNDAGTSNNTIGGNVTESSLLDDILEGLDEYGNSTLNATDSPQEEETSDSSPSSTPTSDGNEGPEQEQGVQDCSRLIGPTRAVTTKLDCDETCGLAPYTYLRQETDLHNEPALVDRAYGGFRCQCRSPPIDCQYVYDFPKCVSVGVMNCDDEIYNGEGTNGNTSISNGTGTSKAKGRNVTNSTSSHGGNATHRTCADLCFSLGFRRDHHLCTRNTVVDPSWTSCACEVDVGLRQDGTLSVTGGFFVCGDDGYETGLMLAGGGAAIGGRHDTALFGGTFLVMMMVSTIALL